MTKERLQALLAEYGRVAIVTYFAIFAATLAGFAGAIALGVNVESASSGLGLFGAAYVATKVTQPLRIAATLAVTPIVARLVRRLKRTPSTPTPPSPTPESADAPRASSPRD